MQNVNSGVFVLVVVLAVWSLGTAVGMIPHTTLPKKWASDYYERAAYLRGRPDSDVAAKRELAELTKKLKRDERLFWAIMPAVIAVIILALALRG